MFTTPKSTNRGSRRVHGLGQVLIGVTLSASVAAAALAVEPTTRCRRGGDRSPDVSARGIKGAIGCGTIEPADEQQLDAGDAGFLAIGYGVDSSVTLWLTAVGSEHLPSFDPDRLAGRADLGGLEFSLQYSVAPKSRLRPFGRIGVGAYSVESRSSHDAMAGRGIRVGLGADYFLSHHCAVGVEWFGRNAHYFRERLGEHGQFRDLPWNIDADAGGILVSLTLQ